MSEEEGADANAIMAQIIDKVDKILFKHGLEFRDEEHSWETAIEELSAWVFMYYEDFGGNGSFEPVSSTSDTDEIEDMDESDEEDPNAEIDI